MISIAASAPLPDWIMSYQRRPVGSASMFGIAGEELREEAHVVGVVGDDQKIERPRQLRRLAGRRRDLLALGEAIGVARAEPCAEGAGVDRERGVEVGVAEERPGREIAPGPGRIRPLGGKDLLGRRLVERADVGDEGVLGKGRQGEAEPGQTGEQNLGEHRAFHVMSPPEYFVQNIDTRWITQNMASVPMR